MTEKVVFDTNVLISGLLWKGTPHRCLLAARVGLIQAISCDPILDEFERTLRDRFQFSLERAKQAKKDILRLADRIEIKGSLCVIASDPDDDKILECAMAGHASEIVSGDHHLKELGEYEGIRILSPSEFLSSLSEAGIN